MASERYIDLQLIKPLGKGSGVKGKISLTNLFKEYFDKLNVGYLDPCCPVGAPGASGCPAISADADNIIECHADGLYATASASVSGANPTASIGLTATNGVATTFMRSDAAPAINQAITPNWTGAHRFTPSSGDEAIRLTGGITSLYAYAADNSTLLGMLTFSATTTGFYVFPVGAAVEMGSGTSTLRITSGSFSFVGGNIAMAANKISWSGVAPTAYLHLRAGAAAAQNAPLKFTAGTNMTTAETGAMEYNGTNLFFTRTGTTRETVFTGVTSGAPLNQGNAAIGDNFYGNTNSIVLGEPNSWANVVINGTLYKIPLYNPS